MTESPPLSPDQEASYFRQICDYMDDYVFMEAMDMSRLYYVSAGYKKICGASPEAVLADATVYYSMIHPDDRARFEECGRALQPVEYRLVMADGSIRWVSDRFFPIFDSDGVCRRRCGISTNITDQKEALTAIRNMATIVQCCQDSIIATDENGAIIAWNAAATAIYGISSEQVLGQSFEQVTGERNRNDFGGDTYEAEHLVGGTIATVEVRHAVVLDADSKIAGQSWIIRDISQRREVDRRIAEFQSMVSHELRTPLTSIRGALSLVCQGVVEANSTEGAELLSIACDSADRLVRLINDLLDLRKLEEGKRLLDKREISGSNFIRKTAAAMQGMALSKNVVLETELGKETDIYADEDRLTQVLTNLISNAIKFSPPNGKVKITCRDYSAKSIKLCVSDSGPGISESDKAKLFQKFQQLDSSNTRSVGGTGLGLAISKALVIEHGGEIGVDSKEGAGSVFWFTIPKSDN